MINPTVGMTVKTSLGDTLKIKFVLSEGTIVSFDDFTWLTTNNFRAFISEGLFQEVK